MDDDIRYIDILRIDTTPEDVLLIEYRERLGPLAWRRKHMLRPVDREGFLGALLERMEEAQGAGAAARLRP